MKTTIASQKKIEREMRIHCGETKSGFDKKSIVLCRSFEQESRQTVGVLGSKVANWVHLVCLISFVAAICLNVFEIGKILQEGKTKRPSERKV